MFEDICGQKMLTGGQSDVFSAAPGSYWLQLPINLAVAPPPDWLIDCLTSFSWSKCDSIYSGNFTPSSFTSCSSSSASSSSSVVLRVELHNTEGLTDWRLPTGAFQDELARSQTPERWTRKAGGNRIFPHRDSTKICSLLTRRSRIKEDEGEEKKTHWVFL